MNLKLYALKMILIANINPKSKIKMILRMILSRKMPMPLRISSHGATGPAVAARRRKVNNRAAVLAARLILQRRPTPSPLLLHPHPHQ